MWQEDIIFIGIYMYAAGIIARIPNIGNYILVEQNRVFHILEIEGTMSLKIQEHNCHFHLIRLSIMAYSGLPSLVIR